MKYIGKNLNLVKFIIIKFSNTILAISIILAFPFLLTLLVSLVFKVNFSLVFSYIFSVYSIIITVILFDYVFISRLQQAKFYNSEEKISEIRKSLSFFLEFILSNATVPLKTWKDNLSILKAYNKSLKKNDKIWLSDKKDVFNELVWQLEQLDSVYKYSGDSLDLSKLTEAHKDLSSECNDKLFELTDYLSMKERMERK